MQKPARSKDVLRCSPLLRAGFCKKNAALFAGVFHFSKNVSSSNKFKIPNTNTFVTLKRLHNRKINRHSDSDI